MDYLSVNQAGWNDRAVTHFSSDFYDVTGFLAGATSLQEIELASLAVEGKSLLHLQCHFGVQVSAPHLQQPQNHDLAHPLLLLQ